MHVGFLAFIEEKSSIFNLHANFWEMFEFSSHLKIHLLSSEYLFIFPSHRGVMFKGEFFFVIELINSNLFKEGKNL